MTLLIEYSCLIVVPTNPRNKHIKLLKIKNEKIKEFIEKYFSDWKNCLYKKYEDKIDLFINHYDEVRIKKIIESLINSSYNYDDTIEKYYTIIYSLLTLCDKYKVITKRNIKYVIMLNYYLLKKDI